MKTDISFHSFNNKFVYFILIEFEFPLVSMQKELLYSGLPLHNLGRDAVRILELCGFWTIALLTLFKQLFEYN